MSKLTLDLANAIITGALEHSRDADFKPLTIAVLDAGGHLIALQRQDGSSIMRPHIAIAKASGALGLGVSSRSIGDMAAERPSFIGAAASLAPNGLVPAAGGVIICSEDGETIGAVGITGDTSDNDESCALAGIAGAGFSAKA